MNKKIVIGVLATALLLIVYRAGMLIVAPGLPVDSLYPLFIQSDFNSYDTIRRFTLFGYGINPYVGMASLVLIIAAFSKKIRGLLMGESSQLVKLERIIVGFTIIYLVLTSYGLNSYMKSIRFSGNLDWQYGEDLLSQLLFIAAKVCGGIVVIYIARAITRSGIINGVVAILLVDSFYQIKAVYASYIDNKHAADAVERFDLLTAVAVVGILIVLSIIILISRREVKIHDPADVGGREVPVLIPLRVNAAGNVPPEIAGSIITLALLQLPQFLGSGMAISNTLYYTLLVILTIVLTFLFAYMSFNPADILSTLDRYGYAVSGNEDKKPVIEYLKYLYRPMVGISIIIAIVLALTPLAMNLIIKIPGHPLSRFSGVYLLMICCVVIDCRNRFSSLKKIDASMIGACSFNTVLEADLFLDRLKKHNIQGVVVNTRVLPDTGTFAYWEICVPSIPYFILHRGLASGAVTVHVNIEHRDAAIDLFKSFSRQDTSDQLLPNEEEKGVAPDEMKTPEHIDQELESRAGSNGGMPTAKELLSRVGSITRKIMKKHK